MDLIKETLEKLNELVAKEFPDYTRASFNVQADGYLSISVIQWEENDKKKPENKKRRELFDQYRVSGSNSWTDNKESQNAYYKQIGVLLEDER